MNFIFFGTPDVSRDTLAHLYESGFKPVAVVTNPDAPKGRGQEMAATPVKEWALAHNLPVVTSLTEVEAIKADLAIVVSYGKILPEALIQSFPLGVLNIHYSLLPRYRGAAPIEAALLNGDKETGVTIQRMVRKLDAGDVVAVEKINIEPADTTPELKQKLIKLGAELLVKILPDYVAGKLTLIPQDEALATHFGKIDKSAGELDLSAPDEENWRKYRAYRGGIGTYFFKDGQRIKITVAHFNPEEGFVIDRVIPAGGKETDYK